MGSRSRRKPAHLPKKLRTIRDAFGVSQDGIIPLLGLSGQMTRAEISGFERGWREPASDILLAYAELAGVWVDVLINDKLDLPDKLPASPKSPGLPRKPKPNPRPPKTDT